MADATARVEYRADGLAGRQRVIELTPGDVPGWVSKGSGASAESRLLLVLVAVAKPDGSRAISQRVLGQITGANRKTVQRVLKRLAGAGIIEVIGSGIETRAYRFDHRILTSLGHPSLQLHHSPSPPGDSEASAQPAHDVPHTTARGRVNA
jgi:hypothetical protein